MMVLIQKLLFPEQRNQAQSFQPFLRLIVNSVKTVCVRVLALVAVPVVSTVLAELLLPKGPLAESHTLKNLVTHRSLKFWLSRDRAQYFEK